MNQPTVGERGRGAATRAMNHWKGLSTTRNQEEAITHHTILALTNTSTKQGLGIIAVGEILEIDIALVVKILNGISRRGPRELRGNNQAPLAIRAMK